MCVIEGCESKPMAKGLCAKHYMRQRRTGDVTRVRKAGRKRSQLLKGFEDWSPLTKQRFAEAVRMLREACDNDEKAESIKAATRPNGTLSVSKLLRIASMRYVMRFG